MIRATFFRRDRDSKVPSIQVISRILFQYFFKKRLDKTESKKSQKVYFILVN